MTGYGSTWLRKAMTYRALDGIARVVYIIDMKTITIRQGITWELDDDMRESYTVRTQTKRGVRITGEHNDCCVRALKTVTGVPYSDAHELMAGLGRSNRNGMNIPMLDTMTLLSHVYGYKVTKVVDDKSGLTLGRAAWRYRTGRYLIIITGHALAIRDGVVVDQGMSGTGCRVKAIYKFTPSSEVAETLPSQIDWSI